MLGCAAVQAMQSEVKELPRISVLRSRRRLFAYNADHITQIQYLFVSSQQFRQTVSRCPNDPIQSINKHAIIDFMKETHFYHQLYNVCYISSNPLVSHFLFTIRYSVISLSSKLMALNSLLCADVPLRNCSITHPTIPIDD